MNPKMKRGSGILLHLTSLPGRSGIGGLGQSGRAFIDFLAEAGQQYWQFLPTGPTSAVFGNSPYMSMSAFAGDPLLLDPDTLAACGLLSGLELEPAPEFSEYLVDFQRVIAYKTDLLAAAFKTFRTGDPGGKEAAFTAFCNQADWLDDYALFMSLREENDQKAWHEWPRPVASRQVEALAAARLRLAARIMYYKFEQFCFHWQWQELRNHAKKKRISLIGDIPFYVGQDSADVWANQELFQLDRATLAPTVIAGVPPDYFSSTGQRWGNPVYCWQTAGQKQNPALLDWWHKRFRHIFAQMDIVRIDHFRGFESYWEIPAEEKTAINGTWVKGPGVKFFKDLEKQLGSMPIIAEDLGLITPAVEKLRDKLGYPGMKVLQFAFDTDAANSYLPHNFKTANCVVYTGTHDNNTTVGWYLSDKASPAARQRLRRYTNSPDDHDIHLALLRLAFSSVADLVITPIQDILGFGEDCRMNKPGTTAGNWRWRCPPWALNQEVGKLLRTETEFYNRLPAPHPKD